MSKLTHLDEHGRASMVDVGEKDITKRSATASGRIFIPQIAYNLVTASYPAFVDDAGKDNDPQSNMVAKSRKKGDVLTIAQLAAIMGAKQTSSLIPLCHPLSLSKIDVKLKSEESKENDTIIKYSIICTATVSCEGKTGVEMEALTAVSVGLLTVWDMLKAVAGKEMEIGEIIVSHKSGGRSGDFTRNSKS